MITRRNLILTGAGVLPLFAAADFWNKKKPSEWSEKEVQALLTKSPWAKDASVEFNMQGMEGGPDGGMGGPPGGGMGGEMPEMHAVVRWEGAMPIRAANKTEAGQQAADTYIISLSGMPMMGGEGDVEKNRPMIAASGGVLTRPQCRRG